MHRHAWLDPSLERSHANRRPHGPMASRFNSCGHLAHAHFAVGWIDDLAASRRRGLSMFFGHFAGVAKGQRSRRLRSLAGEIC